MLQPGTRRALDTCWAGTFGCEPAALRPSAPTLFPRVDGAYHGVYAMEFGAAPVSLVPVELLEPHAAGIADVLAPGLREDARPWRGVFGKTVEAVIGPAALRYTDLGSFRPLPASPAVRILTGDDLPAAEALRDACTPTEWEHGGSDVRHDAAAGSFAGGELAALAGYEVWNGVIAHVAIVTHPAHRGRGHAAAAVSRVTAHALEAGLVAQYRTLESNTPSLAVAERLGFEPWARSLAIRLRGAP